MTRWASEHALKQLVTAIVGSDDPVLCEGACRALDALLTSAEDAGDPWL
jgi:hypothetical protein